MATASLQDYYTYETISESLEFQNRLFILILIAVSQKLSAVCSLIPSALNNNLFTRPKFIAKRSSTISGQSHLRTYAEVSRDLRPKVRVTTSDLWAMVPRLRSFPKITYPTATHIRGLLISRLIFESEFPMSSESFFI